MPKPAHPDYLRDDDEAPDAVPWWASARAWLERNQRGVTSGLVIGAILAAAAGVIVFQNAAAERAAREQVFSLQIPYSMAGGDLDAQIEALEMLRDTHRESDAYPVILYRIGVAYHRAWRFTDALEAYNEARNLVADDHPLAGSIESGLLAVGRDEEWMTLERPRLSAEHLVAGHPLAVLGSGVDRFPAAPRPQADPEITIRTALAESVTLTVDPDRAPELAAWILEQVGSFADATATGDGRVVRVALRGLAAPEGAGFDVERGVVALRRLEGESELWIFLDDPVDAPADLIGVGRLTSPADPLRTVVAPTTVFSAEVTRRRD